MQLIRVVVAALVALGIVVVPVSTASAHKFHAGLGEPLLIPSTGWHGRQIHNPHRHDATRKVASDAPMRGWSAGPVSFGAGYHRPGGSVRVREVQQRLRRLGFRPGPVDGLFGPLTRSAVAWFQVKHGLRVDGRATLATVRHLRAGTSAARDRAQRSQPAATSPRTSPHVSGAEPRSDRKAATASPVVSPDATAARKADSDSPSVASGERRREEGSPFVWLAALSLLLVAALAVVSWRRAALARSADGLGESPAPKTAGARTLAYVLVPAGEPDDQRFESHAAEIETECAARGLALAGLIADVEDSRLVWQRPGLATAVRRLVDGEVDFLMVTKIEEGTDADLKRLLDAMQDEIAIARWQRMTRGAPATTAGGSRTTDPPAKRTDERETSNA